jgi:NAD(P)-dependent dehydrogenase (short-subunit alcohol dehydrogenase family)
MKHGKEHEKGGAKPKARTAIITGAFRGIGKAIAIDLARGG